MSMGEALELIPDGTTAREAMTNAYASRNAANVLGVVAALCLGFTVGEAIAGDDMHWWVGGIGLISMGAAFSFGGKSKTQADHALELYHAGLKKTGINKTEFQLYIGPRMGFALRF